MHFNNLHIRNQPSSYSISNGLNTYTIADAIANLPDSPRIWNNLFHDIEEIIIPNVPMPDDGYEEIELPNNTGMLAWPANSGEVTLWFGIVDALFYVEHKGLDIQDDIGAPVYSISDGTVADIYSDPFYGNVVAIDFLYYGVHKQTKYNHMGMVDVTIGESVTKGQTIGRMSRHKTVNKGLLEVRLYRNSIAIDPFVFMERPDYDISYLSYPMAYSMETGREALMQLVSLNLYRSMLVDSQGNSLSDLEMHERYMENLDLELGEVYLRKWAYEYVINLSEYLTPEEFEERGFLKWCEATKTATFTYNGVVILEVVTQPESSADSQSVTSDNYVIRTDINSLSNATTHPVVTGVVRNNRTTFSDRNWLIHITLDPIGGTVRSEKIKRGAGSPIGSLPHPTKPGYFFLGWFTTVNFDPEESILIIPSTPAPQTNVIYYAHWRPIAFSVGADFRSLTRPREINTIREARVASEHFHAAGYLSSVSTRPTLEILRGNIGNSPRMQSSILYFAGHGSYRSIMFNHRQRGGEYYTGVVHGIGNARRNVGILDNRMDSVQLVTFAGCRTASGEVNLLTRSIDQGATTAVGFTLSPFDRDLRAWSERYTYHLSIGGTVQQAVYYANNYSYSDPSVKSSRIMGDQSLRILLDTSSNNSSISEINSSLSENASIVSTFHKNEFQDQEDKLFDNVKQRIYYISADDKSFNFHDPDYTDISSYIKKNIDHNFDIINHTIHLSNSFGADGSIEFVYTVNGIETNVSYVVIVNDGICIKVATNGDISNVKALRNLPIITYELLEIAKSKAHELINTSDTYILESQRTRPIIDINSNNVYIYVFSELKHIETNTFIVDGFRYRVK